MKNKLLVVALFFFIPNIMSAQSSSTTHVAKQKKVSRVGLQFGANRPSMIFTKISDQSIYPKFKSYTKFNGGIYSESGATDNFVFHIGLFYSGAGYKTKDETLSLDYIQVPFIFNFRTDVYQELFLQLGGGFYGGFAFSGRSETDTEINRDILSINSSNKPFLYWDAGLLLKADLEYSLNEKKVIKLGASYGFGILNTSKEYTKDPGTPSEITYSDFGARNRIFSINISYLINLNKNID